MDAERKYSTQITAIAFEDGEEIASIEIKHKKLTKEGLVLVEGSMNNLVNEQFDWGRAAVAEAAK
jgi:hypothetical protein